MVDTLLYAFSVLYGLSSVVYLIGQPKIGGEGLVLLPLY